MTKFGLAGVLAVMAGASGCLTMGTVQTADTLGKGHFQVSAEPGIWGLGARNPNGSISTPSNIPHVDAAFRYGVNDRLDLGIRSGFSLIELQAKVLFTDQQADTLAMSLAPTLGFGFFSVTDPLTLDTQALTYANLGIP